MVEIEFVVAMSRNRVIGKDGTLPWHIPSELKRFKQLTMGKPVIMGRKTWESLPRRPLPGRTNIVISQQQGYSADGGVTVLSKADALKAAGSAPQVSIIGGASVFEMFMADVERVYLTVVDIEVEGDTFFPELEPEQWVDNVIERVPVDSTPGAPAFEVHRLDRVSRGRQP